MYRYDEFDSQMVADRVAQFRGQVARRLSGEMTEDQFKPLRLMNGVYLQLHAYMLRVAVPYGTMNAAQMRQLAMIARKYDKGFGHFTTRQNIQFNWPALVDIPDILDDLAKVEMHAIQTSGNCIRNVTSDPYAGVIADEIDDPRIWSEIIRQWSTFHPEFTYLPRKFKIAVTASDEENDQDRAAIQFHDIGLRILKRDDVIGFRVYVGGGLGRSPHIGEIINEFVPHTDIIAYLESILQVYNLAGRRDNLYKARIKITVREMGMDAFNAEVNKTFVQLKDGPIHLPDAEIDRIRYYFEPPAYENFTLAQLTKNDSDIAAQSAADPKFANWVKRQTVAHKQAGYAIVNIALKAKDMAPGDITARQMEAVADIAERYSFGEIRSTHEQNLVLAHVAQSDLYAVYTALAQHQLATAVSGLISDIIACPGLDYCNLANTRSIPIANDIQAYFDEDAQADIGEMKIKISGCINACGHHHVGHIGILGVDKRGEEYFQITLGGSANDNAAIGEIVGRGLPAHQIVPTISKMVDLYRAERRDDESFMQLVGRIGTTPFKEKLA